jgi:hypothetical protein
MGNERQGAMLALGDQVRELRAAGVLWKDIAARLHLCRTRLYQLKRNAEKRPLTAARKRNCS